MDDPSCLKAIVFDFDGVILESVNIKTKAFQRLFETHPEHLGQIIRLHLENGGMSRFEKFEIIYRDFLKRPLTETESAQLGQQFSELVVEEVLRCPFVKGAEHFLTKYAKRYPLFVASGTPQSELEDIVNRRGLSHHFRGVYGSPRLKQEIIDMIVEENGWQPRDVMFIGDSINDQEAATQSGVRFIGRVAPGQLNRFQRDVAIVEDLTALDRQWEHFSKQTTMIA